MDTRGEPQLFAQEIRILGPLTVLSADEPVSMPLKQRALLGLLAVQQDQTVSHEEIADILWPGDAPPAYPQLVHTYVARLRRIIEPAPGGGPSGSLRRISTVRGGYAFNSGAMRLDLARFEELAALAARSAAHEPAAALDFYQQALRCWQGRLLQDLPQLWHHPSVARVAQRHIDVAIEFADLARRLNRSAFAVEYLRVASYEEPLHEALQARIMLALADSGRRAAAMRLFTDLRMRLKRELGVEPSAEIWQARNSILTQDSSADRGRPVSGEAAGAASPAPGQQYGPPAHGWNWRPMPGVPTQPSARSRSLAPPAQLPAVISPFVGREPQLAALDALLAPRRERCAAMGIAVIHGPPEMGKTALAVRWAHQRHEDFPDGQLYADLRGSAVPSDGPVHPRTVLTRFLRSLGVPGGRMPDTLEEASALFRSLLAGRRFLVVLDDVVDAAQVRCLLPGTSGNVVLVTSRTPVMDLVTREGAVSMALDVLSATEAYKLIETHLGPERTAAELEATRNLVAVCGQYPLELRMAVARLAASPHVSIQSLVAELVRIPGSLQRLT
ncbi:BTAD domain-containing putative transcriptional regulator [Streptomyces hypolithicus]